MKIVTLISFLFLLIIPTCFGQLVPQGWFQQNNPVFSDLNSVSFINEFRGFAAGANGVIIKTSNGGVNWIQQFSGTTKRLVELKIVSLDAGYVIGDSGLILNTTNGGINWIQQVSGSTNNLTSSSIVNDSTGYICGLNKTLLKTINGGNNWNSLTFPDSLNFYSIYFINSSTGWLSAENPKVFFEDSAFIIFKTTTGGGNWVKQFNSYREYTPFQQLQFTDSLNGWMVLHSNAIDYSSIYKTTDGGNSWTEYPLGNSGKWSIYFINERKGWAAGPMNRISRTTDGGVNWVNSIALPASIDYYSICLVDSLTGWTVGKQGIILKTTTGGILTNFTNTSIEIPDKYYLSQNYPNPFNPVTNISYNITLLIPPFGKGGTGGFVQLKVYDVLGNEIKTLVNESKPAGSYEVEFDARDARQGSILTSGIYFYSLLIDGNVIDTKRMILLK